MMVHPTPGRRFQVVVTVLELFCLQFRISLTASSALRVSPLSSSLISYRARLTPLELHANELRLFKQQCRHQAKSLLLNGMQNNRYRNAFFTINGGVKASPSHLLFYVLLGTFAYWALKSYRELRGREVGSTSANSCLQFRLEYCRSN